MFFFKLPVIIYRIVSLLCEINTVHVALLVCGKFHLVSVFSHINVTVPPVVKVLYLCLKHSYGEPFDV